jgi:hypothetical protein
MRPRQTDVNPSAWPGCTDGAAGPSDRLSRRNFVGQGGFLPRIDDRFEFDPLILRPRLASLDWGPYAYKQHSVGAHWGTSRDSAYAAGLTIFVDAARFHSPEPRHLLLYLHGGALHSVPLQPDPLEVPVMEGT